MGALRRSFQLVKVCLAVLGKDKELLLFPVLSTLALLLVVASLFGIGVSLGTLERLAGPDQGAGAGAILLLFLFYVAAYFVIIFFNSALVYAAYERLGGGDPTVRSGLRGAARRLPSILLWAVVAATVGLLLNAIERAAERAGGGWGRIAGRIVVGILGTAWSLATYFVVPLLVIEGRGLGESLRGSVSLLRRTWGEQIVGNAGLGLAALVFTLAGGAVLMGLGFLLAPLGAAGLVPLAVLAVVAVLGIALVFSTLGGIYTAALYRYAATGQVPALFPQEVIRQSWRPHEGPTGPGGII